MIFVIRPFLFSGYVLSFPSFPVILNTFFIISIHYFIGVSAGIFHSPEVIASSG